MSRTLLRVEVAALSTGVRRALGFLVRDDRLRVSIRRIQEPRRLPKPGVLRIEPASLLYPALTVLWADPKREEVLARPVDARAALTNLVWEGHGPESGLWLETAAPLPRHVRFGTPDPGRPWLLTLQGPRLRNTPHELAQLTGLENPQPHALVTSGASFARGGVLWVPRRSTLASLLGHVDAVVGLPCALTWDAVRLGVPVFEPTPPDEPMNELIGAKLANVVPAALAEQATFWRALALDFVSGERRNPWGTLAWVGQTRALTASTERSSSVFSRMRRKARKLQRNPRAFIAESWIVKRALRLT